VRLTMPGWTEGEPTSNNRIWRNIDGDVIGLAVPKGRLGPADLSDVTELRGWSRHLAQSRGAGLIEVCIVHGRMGSGFGLIYKRLEMPAYIYTGWLIVPIQNLSLVWTMVAKERGITGEREAIVTSQLIGAGKLKTLEDLERCWARDPYDPAYHGVDRSVLRFLSDDECYDKEFPDHPLSKVRRLLLELPGHVEFPS
jgi:hypothetical protein